MTDEQERALRDFNAAGEKIRKGLSKNGGGAAAEKDYSAAYQRLVQLGLRPQIKYRYR